MMFRFYSIYETPEGTRKLSSRTKKLPLTSLTRSDPQIFAQILNGGFTPTHSFLKFPDSNTIFLGIIFSLRLFYIQVINHDWSERAAEISLTTENLQPPRGFIYDRNNNLLVGSDTLYDLFILPIAVKHTDTVIICDVFNFSRSDFREILNQSSSGYTVLYKPSVFINSMSQLEHAKISPFIGQISAIHAESKLDRGYPFPIASHLLGYIRRIDEKQFQNTRKADDLFYTKNDFIGITGLEKQ